MFRFNNPDALLTLLLTGAAYATVRALESGRTRWMVLAGALIGFGFITKMLQAIILMPVLALVYLLAGPPKLGRRRASRSIYSGVALVVAGGWWVAAVQLTPAADRPYIGGSTDNNLLNLIFGYNGFGRLTGNETGSVGGGSPAAAGSMWGPTGWNRLFLREMGGQISWLIPGRAHRAGGRAVADPPRPATDRIRAGFLLFGGLAPAHRGHPQLRPRHHPPLLHGRPGPGHRRPGGHGCVHPVEPAAGALPPAGAGRGHRGHHRLGLRHPRLEPRLVPGAAVGHPGGRAPSPPSASLSCPGPGACWPPASPASGSPRSSPRRPPTPSTRRRPRTAGPSPRPVRPCRVAVASVGRSDPAVASAVPGGPLGFAGTASPCRRDSRCPTGSSCPVGVHIPGELLPAGPADSGRRRRPARAVRSDSPGGRGWLAGRGGFGGGAAGGLLNGSTPGKQLTALLERRRLPVLVGGRHHRLELGLGLPAGHR